MLIEVDQVSKIYKTHGPEPLHALQLCSFGIAQGEFVSVVGPSGCGKSTLLRLIAGLDRPSSGSISLAELSVTGPNPKVSIVFQSPVLLPWRRIIDQLLLVPEIRERHRYRRRQYLAEAHELLRMVGLEGFERAYPKELSGGMAQRCSIARALMRKSDCLLLDEPFGALDALTRESMNVWLSQLWSGSDRTALLITHDIDEAILLSDRVIVMSSRPGQIVAEFPVSLQRPRDPKEILGDPAAVALRVDIRRALAGEVITSSTCKRLLDTPRASSVTGGESLPTRAG